jgi:hypothetical protein
MARSSIRSMSAFCDGGNGVDEKVMRFQKRLHMATTNRMGMIVKVYRKESRQRMKPNPMICGIEMSSMVK